jgi:hypothetical protein
MDMADQDDARRIALSLPGAREAKDRFAFSVEDKGKPKGFVWVWMERVHPKKEALAAGPLIGSFARGPWVVPWTHPPIPGPRSPIRT